MADNPLQGFTPVDRSLAIGAHRYDPITKTLDVAFTNGRVGRYKDVPEDIHFRFINAKSMGRFLQTQLRDEGYEYEDITDQFRKEEE
jgi:hypothetical protein